MNKVITTSVILLILAFASYQLLKPGEQEEPAIAEVLLSDKDAKTEPQDGQSPAADEDDDIAKLQPRAGEEHQTTGSASPAALESFLTQDGDSVVLDTEVLEKYTVNELRDGIRNMDPEGDRDQLAIEAEYQLESKLKGIKGTNPDALRCAKELCALLFSSFEEAMVLSAIDDLTRDPEINALTNGGVVYRVEENGIYYGVLVTALDRGHPLRIK